MTKDSNLDISETSYTFLETIGKGSFGQVFKCIHNDTGMTVAIKIIDLEKAEDDLEDIQKEIMILGQCDCENVTKYHLSKIVGHELWIVMEYLGGGSVFDLLQMGAIEEAYVSILMREILKGLIYLHGEGKIHRDIKCANILLSENGNVKLADFGVAGQLTDTFNKKNTFVGTPFWMAPEVIKQAAYDFKADIWSLGITLYEMVYTVPPHFEMHPMKALFTICKDNPPELSQTFSKNIKEFFLLCVNKNPDFRPEAKVLIRHKFVKTAKKTSALIELLDRFKTYASNNNGFNNSPMSGDDDRSEDSPNKNKQENLPNWIFETVKVAKNMVVSVEEHGISISERSESSTETFKTDSKSSKSDAVMDELTNNVSESSLESTRKSPHTENGAVANSNLSTTGPLTPNSTGDRDEVNGRKKSLLHKSLFKPRVMKDKESSLTSEDKKTSSKHSHSSASPSLKKSENRLLTILKFLYESQLSSTDEGAKLFNKINSDHHTANKLYTQIASFASPKKTG